MMFRTSRDPINGNLRRLWDRIRLSSYQEGVDHLLSIAGEPYEIPSRSLIKSCTRAGRSDGQFLKTEYGIWSVGLGDDDGLHRFRISITSTLQMGAMSKGTVGSATVFIQFGFVNDAGSLL